MSFNPPRARTLAPARSAPVMAVGRRVFINAGSHARSLALADVEGTTFSAVHLPDGLEVEVIAWRPGGKNGTRYRVRTATGADGWLAAENLRGTLVPAPVVPAAPAAPATVERSGGRRFGQR